MNSLGGYTTVKVGEIPEAKLRKALAGNAIRLTNAELTGDRVMVVHKLNAKAIRGAQKKGKGLDTTFSSGEADADLAYHNHVGAGMSGGSLWSWLGKAGKKVYGFVKDNWSDIKPLVSKAVDAATQAAATAAGPYAPAVLLARQGLKSVSGVGLVKGSPEMKAKMAALRAKRGGSFSAGSFKIN